MSEISIGTTEITLGLNGKETGKRLVPCFDIGFFAVHETSHRPGKWTCTHKPTGFSVAADIPSVWDAIECAHASIRGANECGLDASIADPSKLMQHPGWAAFKVRGAEIRAAFSSIVRPRP